jgi:hypothetical protein
MSARKVGRYTVAKGARDETVMVAAAPKEAHAAELAARKYAALLDAHARNEMRLARLLRAWDKSRAALRRAEKRMDKAIVAKAHAEARPAEPPPFDDDLP